MSRTKSAPASSGQKIATLKRSCALLYVSLLLPNSVQADQFGYSPNGYLAVPDSYDHSLNSEIETLWKVAHAKHFAATSKTEIASLFKRYESSLQAAAQAYETGEPSRPGWVSELLSAYTDITHKFPPNSKLLDQILADRTQLVRLTNEKTIRAIELHLKRVPEPEFSNAGDFRLPKFRPQSNFAR